jgi:hypothetical protein
VRDGEIAVHYPARQPDGRIAFGAGFPIGPVPAHYWTSPPNAITAERVALWRELGATGGGDA